MIIIKSNNKVLPNSFIRPKSSMEGNMKISALGWQKKSIAQTKYLNLGAEKVIKIEKYK